MPRRNRNVKRANAKRVKHTTAGPRLARKLARTRRYIADPNDPSRTVVAWQPGRFTWGTRRRAA